MKASPLTSEEYLRIEREAPYRSEYYRGEMVPMTPSGVTHSLIVANLIGTIGFMLRGRPPRAFGGDLRLCIPGDDLYTYPDLSIFCAPLAFMPGTDDTTTNPTIIIEVLSKSTEAYDRGRKFEHYRQLASLREYILVSQDAPTIERFTREGEDRWVLTTHRGLDAVVPLEAIETELPLAEVYDKVEFSPAASSTAVS